MIEGFPRYEDPGAMRWPVSLNVELTNICNEKCPYCENPLLRYPKGRMSLESFRDVLDRLSFLTSCMEVTFCGYGEPFCNPGIYDMAGYCRERAVPFSIVTNGTIPFRSERMETLLGAREFRVTLDAVSPDVYRLSRPVGSPETVIQNLEKIINHRSRGGGPFVNVRMNVFRFNRHEIGTVVDLCNRIGVDRIQIAKGCAPPDVTTDIGPDDISGFPPGLVELVVPAEEESSPMKMAPHLPLEPVNLFSALACPATTIRWDGTVCPCCYDQAATVPLGNLLSPNWPEVFSAGNLEKAGAEILSGFFRRVFLERRAIACDRCEKFWQGYARAANVSRGKFLCRSFSWKAACLVSRIVESARRTDTSTA